jgi:hypothetical protein
MNLKSKLEKDNFELFFRSLNKKNSNMYNKYNKHFKDLPSIPKIYFNDRNSIIDTYHKIKNKIDKLIKIKELLFFILDCDKEIFQKITISREDNFLFERNLLPEFKVAKKYILKDKYSNYLKSNIKLTETEKKFIIPEEEYTNTNKKEKKIKLLKYPFQTDEICIFLNKIKENKNLINNISSSQFHPSEIFKNEFLEKDKAYYLRLLDQYQSLRNELFDEITPDNFGIMAFEHFFDISYIDKIKEKNKKLSNKLGEFSVNNKINYNKYVYINDNEDKLIRNSENKKEKLFKKINEYNIFYTNFSTPGNIKLNYKKNITEIYNNLNNSINSYVGSNTKNNLYDILKSSIDTDFFLLQFLCTYIDPDLFNIVIDNDFKVKKYILYKINQFQNYYSSYEELILRLTKSNNENTSYDKLISFEKFIENLNFFKIII